MRDRGVLTEDDRALFRGDKDLSDVDDPEEYRAERRYRVRRRIARIGEDLEILRDAGEEELLDDFYSEIDMDARVAEELEALREEMQQLREAVETGE